MHHTPAYEHHIQRDLQNNNSNKRHRHHYASQPAYQHHIRYSQINNNNNDNAQARQWGDAP